MPPFFSIIIPTYNRAKFLPDTLQSVMDQNYANWECIVVDDGSTDETEDVIELFSDERIRYYRKKHEERSIARNYGIDKVKGEFICFLDSDDLYEDNHLSVLYEKIHQENKAVAVYYTANEKIVNGQTSLLPTYSKTEFEHPVVFVLKHFLFINSVCVHHDIFKRFRFPEKFHIWEDTHLWLRILANYPFYQIEQVTTSWHLHAESSVTKNFDKVDILKLKMYLDCIADLEHHHMADLNGQVTARALKDYQFEKYSLLMRTAFINRQYNTFYKGITLGFEHFKSSRVMASVVSCLLTSNKLFTGSRKVLKRVF
jgi:glycosyltransferase involved in cell wall biosynthesis